MAKSNLISRAVRGALAVLFGAKREGFVSSAQAVKAAGGTIEEAKARVTAAEDGAVAAREFASYLCQLQAEVGDADGVLSDVQAILCGEKGPDAFNAFAAELYGLMTNESREPDGSKPRAFNVGALLSHIQPNTLTDSVTGSEAEGGEIFAQMVVSHLRTQDEYPKDVQGTIAGMRVILLGKYGAACRDAFLSELRKTMVRKVADPKAPHLQTERDGRLYAIGLLEAMEEEVEQTDGLWSPFAHSAEGPLRDNGRVCIFRTKPQSATLAHWVGELHKYGTAEAIAGFYVVFSDYIGLAIEDAQPKAADYAQSEKDGEFDPWGSVIYTNPKAAAAAIEKGDGDYDPKARKVSRKPQKPTGKQRK